MAAVQCSKCTAERKGFRRELDSWRHKLIHCVGFESILEGIYGQMLLRDLNLFDDCEPEEVGDWSPSATCSHCSFCNLPLDKLSDRAPAATPPLSSPSDYSPCQAPTISESSQSAHRFLQAVFHKKDVPLGCDSNIPLVAQELMVKMIRQFALEYASKCLLHTSTNGATTRTSSPLSDTSDAPLDLTVGRNQEEKESEPDGVLDLSNRNSACSVTSSTSSSKKASGSLPPSLGEDLGDLGQQEKKCHQSSALDAVLRSLCPSHSSLLYEILKLAHQEKLLSVLNRRPVTKMESSSCHCGVNSQGNVAPNAVPFSECKAHNSSLYYPLTDCDLQGHGSKVYHPGDCKSNCSIHHYPLTNCKGEAPRSSSYCCLQRSRMETYSVLCPERLHYISCQSLAVGCTNNVVCSTPSLCNPASLCRSSLICCNQHSLHSCPCYSNHACMTQVTQTIESVVGDGDPPFPVLKREQSPSPPPLSPIPSDISKKTNEKPPSLLHHRQEEEADRMMKGGLVNAIHQEADMDAATEEEREGRTPRSSCAEQNPSGTLLQDVMNRFSERLETIGPIEKDPPLASTTVYIPGMEPLQSPSTSENLQFHADAHLTEIITTVLHTGSASDYNLSELFNRHDSKEPKSPNTRSRRRQEVLAAMATPANDVSTRRHSLQIKRELAMLDRSHGKRKVPAAKRAKLKDENVTATALNTSPDSKREMGVDVEPLENHRVMEGPLNSLTTESDRDKIKDEIQTVIVTEPVEFIKTEEKEKLVSNEEKFCLLSGTQILKLAPELQSKFSEQEGDSVQTQEITVTGTSAEQCGGTHKDGTSNSARSDGNNDEAPSISDRENTACESKDYRCPPGEEQKCQSHHSKESRRSRRNIVPPQRFSSYVTEPRKMFFVACFSENIFNQTTEKDKAMTSSTLDGVTLNPDGNDTQLESSSETPLSSSPEHVSKFTLPLPQSTHREECGPSLNEESNSLSTNHALPLLDVAVKGKSLKKHSSDNGTDGWKCGAKGFGYTRSSGKRLPDLKTTSATPQNTTKFDATKSVVTCVESPPNSQVPYTSPIKLMFVSQVKDKEGVRYSLKSAGTASRGEAEEPFDPCEESSWSGSMMKQQTQSIQSATSRERSASSTPKSASSTPKSSSSSSPKSASSSPKSASSTPKSASSAPKSALSPSKSALSPSKSALSPSKSASSSCKSSSSSPKSASSPRKSSSSSPKSASSPRKSSSSSPKSASSPRKSSSSSPKSASSPRKSSSSSPKSASSSPKSSPSPRKSASSPRNPSSPAKSVSSPKSASSSPKMNSRRSGDGTPTKRVAATDSQRSPGGLLCHHETTPKRRPGRPKKLGPQLEQKVKRPIGRPRKQKTVDSVTGANAGKGKSDMQSDAKENVNKNLKITVVYGRSRRHKRTVSEGCDQLHTEFHPAGQAVGLKSGLGILMHNSNTNSGSIGTTSTELSEEFNLISRLKESSRAPQPCSSIKCQKQDGTATSRKPGRPAKVKISGISVTVTTMSPRQRKIQINKDARQSPETLVQKKVLQTEVKSTKEPGTISRQSTGKVSLTEEGIETKDDNEDTLPNEPVALRHSMRVRKPSIHFLYAVATSTSRSYSHSNALLRRSKQLLLNKASNQRRQVEQQSGADTSGGKRTLCGRERKSLSQDLSRVAGLSVDSIFSPKKTLRWWAVSAEERTLNLELARRIRLISDTWVSDTVERQEKEVGSLKSKHSSVVRSLFDCSPNKPRSCSVQQLCSWFMQTTETQSLAIVKKASSRNPYELMHFPRSTNKKDVYHSPQAERLRKHIKKFAKIVPKSPLQNHRAQNRLRGRNETPPSTHSFRRQLFTSSIATGECNRAQRRRRRFGKYQATLFRARTRFLNRKERLRRQQRQRNKKNAIVAKSYSDVVRLYPKCKALRGLAKYHLYDCWENSFSTCSVDQTQEPMGGPKEQNLCSKAWSPETLKECRVFLRKINSPHNESTEEEWDSCTVTLDDGSPSTYVFARREGELVEVVKAVKTKRKGSVNGAASNEQASCAPKSVQQRYEVPMGRQRGKRKRPGALSTEPPQPPPAKMLRQSRMRGLTGPRWCDFVLEN